LRVGLLCNGSTFQEWQALALRHVRAVPGVELVVVVENAGPPPAGLRNRLLHWNQFLYRQFRKRWFKPAAMNEVDLTGELGKVPRILCTPERHGVREHVPPEVLEQLRRHRPDVLLRFGFNILSGEILTLAPHGVWSFHHGDEEHFRGGPPGFWEILKGAPVTGAILQRLTEKLDGGMVLRKGWFATIDHSLEETVDTVLRHTAIWPAQVMRAILDGDTRASVGASTTSPGRLYSYPGNITFLKGLWKLLRNKIRFHQRELQEHEEWNIGVLYQPISAFLEQGSSMNVRWLPAPAPDNFRADPFGYMTSDGTLNVLYEKFDHATDRGEISRVRPRKDNVLKRSRIMLQGSGHLSYPYVVQQADAVHVVPESADSGKVVLHRVNADNDAIEPVATLLEEALFDPTLFQHNGRWWLFGTAPPLSNVALYAYHSATLEGPYQPHALNPIKLDIRSARPAGTPFVKDGRLYRPAQDSSITYGGRIALNEILELSPTRFAEHTVKHIEPIASCPWDKGIHTIAAVGDITLIDGKRFVTVAKRKSKVKQRKLDRLKRNTGS
jgi:folate-dependent phosphoribosylglycinamide formyltransferase PurN